MQHINHLQRFPRTFGICLIRIAKLIHGIKKTKTNGTFSLLWTMVLNQLRSETHVFPTFYCNFLTIKIIVHSTSSPSNIHPWLSFIQILFVATLVTSTHAWYVHGKTEGYLNVSFKYGQDRERINLSIWSRLNLLQIPGASKNSFNQI